MAGYVFAWPALVRQLGRAGDVARTTAAVAARLPGFCRRYHAAYRASVAGEDLPADAPPMRPFAYLALVVVLTALIVPTLRLVAGLPAVPDGVAAAGAIAGADVAVVHLGRLSGVAPLDGFLGECARFASYALLAGLFRLIGGRGFEFAWIAGFFAYVVGAFEAVQLAGVAAATAAGLAEPDLAAPLTGAVGGLALAATVLYALGGPAFAWPGALALPRGRVVRTTVLAVLAWAALHAAIRIALLRRDVLLLGFGL